MLHCCLVNSFNMPCCQNPIAQIKANFEEERNHCSGGVHSSGGQSCGGRNNKDQRSYEWKCLDCWILPKLLAMRFSVLMGFGWLIVANFRPWFAILMLTPLQLLWCCHFGWVLQAPYHSSIQLPSLPHSFLQYKVQLNFSACFVSSSFISKGRNNLKVQGYLVGIEKLVKWATNTGCCWHYDTFD